MQDVVHTVLADLRALRVLAVPQLGRVRVGVATKVHARARSLVTELCVGRKTLEFGMWARRFVGQQRDGNTPVALGVLEIFSGDDDGVVDVLAL